MTTPGSAPRDGSPSGRRCDERGVTGTLLVAAGLLLLSAVVAGAFLGVLQQITAHRAQGTADLVAITAAQAKNKGTSEPCEAASRAAAAAEATLLECRVAGSELTFVATVRIRSGGGPGWFGLPAPVEAVAHAGVDHLRP